MLLATALDNFLVSKMGVNQPITIAWYRKRLKSLLEMYPDLGVENITPEHLDKWRADLATRTTRYNNHPTRPSINTRGLSVYTLHGHIRAARALFRFCKRRGYTASNVAEDLKLPRLPKEPPKHITDDNIDKLLLAAQDKPRDYAIIIVLACTGCRVGGLAGLTRDHVDLDAGIIETHEKFNQVNNYYLTEEPLAALRYWLEISEPNEYNAVFPNAHTGEPLKESGIYQAIKRLSKKARVTGRWNPHSFRHHKARELLENGAGLDAVAEILHHTDISTTVKFYSRWTQGEIQKKHQRFSRKHYPKMGKRSSSEAL